METINDILKTLSPEEIKQHKNLIAECLEREKNVNESGKIIKENFNKLCDISESLFNNLNTLKKKCDTLNKNLMDIKNTNILRSLSDDQFFKGYKVKLS